MLNKTLTTHREHNDLDDFIVGQPFKAFCERAERDRIFSHNI